MEVLFQSLSRSVLLLSSIGVVMLSFVTFYYFRRKYVSKDSKSIMMLSKTLTTSLGILAASVALLSAFQTLVGKKVQHDADNHLPIVEAHPIRKDCPKDPVTGQPYAEVLTVSPKEHLTGRTSGAGVDEATEWQFSKQFPGPVSVVTATLDGPFTKIQSCDALGNNIKCTGTTNGGDARVRVSVKWSQPCDSP